MFLEKVKNVKDDNRFVTPTVITRSVGLQVAVDSNPVSLLSVFAFHKMAVQL